MFGVQFKNTCNIMTVGYLKVSFHCCYQKESSRIPSSMHVCSLHVDYVRMPKWWYEQCLFRWHAWNDA